MHDLDITPVVAAADTWRGRLGDIYAALPETTCERRTRCCANAPEIEAIEYANICLALTRMDTPERQRRLMRSVIYFFSNAALVQPCPLLEGKDCLVYADRPFSCRAYGLWSREHHEAGVAASREAKAKLKEVWAGLGVKLPREVTEFSPPYCDRVRPTHGHGVDDPGLEDVQDRTHGLGVEVFDPDDRFGAVYFHDFTFALAARVLGYQRCLQQKVLATREIVKLDDSPSLRRLLPEVERFGF